MDPRFAKAVPIRLRYNGSDDFLRAYTEHEGLAGVFVATHVDVAVGTPVLLTIELQPGKGMQVGAVVAWRREAVVDQAAGVGLRFVEMREQLRQWLAQAAAKYRQQHQPPPPAPEQPRQHLLRRATGHLTDQTLDIGALSRGEGGRGIILGVDLGTSNSCACVYREGQPEILALEQGSEERTVPSIVAFDDAGTTIVGERALEGLARNAKRTIYGSKRFIGRNYDNPEVQTMLPHYPYKVIPGPDGKVAAEINGRPVSFTAISAKILQYIRDQAERTLRQPVHRAVVTVPAYYNQNQRQAVNQAGRLSGLTVERILNEPTAAALAYGMLFRDARTILVYDLGGGTFDVSVMSVRGRALTVLATAGDTFLGGEDFDAVIVDHVCERFEAKRKARLSRNHAARASIKVAAENAKKRLTLHERSMVMVRQALMADGSTQRLEVEINRGEVNGLVAPLVERTLKICDMAVAQARLKTGNIDQVILVGGQTLMPLVRQRVEQHFGKPPVFTLRADEVVALGAGLLAQLHDDPNAATTFQDVLSMSIGLALPGGKFLRLIERGTALPHSKRHELVLQKTDLDSLVLDVYQGESDQVQRNEHLGSLPLKKLVAWRGQEIPLAIDFILSPDCLLKVRVTNTNTGKETDVLLDTREQL